jgi:catechol 2,3-dioxygenase-like lactoylglutathione lyase family enzyme
MSRDAFAEAPQPAPFKIQKLGHIVLNCSSLERSIEFYRDVLGFQISDRYSNEMVPGGMAFMRCGTDHHTLALVGDAEQTPRSALNHFAFEVAGLEEIFRAREWLQAHGVRIEFQGRRRAGCQISLEFEDPDGNHVEIYWGVDQVGTDGNVRPSSEWRQEHTLEDAVRNPVPGQVLIPEWVGLAGGT